jgi:hypothetical protein
MTEWWIPSSGLLSPSPWVEAFGQPFIVTAPELGLSETRLGLRFWPYYLAQSLGETFVNVLVFSAPEWGLFEPACLSASVSARQKAAFARLSPCPKFPFPDAGEPSEKQIGIDTFPAAPESTGTAPGNAIITRGRH